MPFVQIPESLAAARETCMAALVASQSDGMNLYAVIDLAASGDAEFWHVRLAGAAACSLFDGQPESSAAPQAPWLLRIDAGDTRIGFRRIVEEALVAWNITWLASTLPLDELAKRLSRRLTARLPEGEVLFRYYDPRLFPDWWHVLSNDERAVFGAFGACWWTLAANGTLHAETLAGEPADDPFQPPWWVAPAQQQALTKASECQQLVSFLGKRRPAAFLNKNRGEQWQFVRTHDAQARARGVTHFIDRLRYCELALEYGGDFAVQPRWQSVWVATARSQRLAAALEQLLPEATASPSTRGITI